MPTATITINVTTFVENPPGGGTSCCTIDQPVITRSGNEDTFTNPDGLPRVYMKTDDPSDKTIYLRRRGADAIDINFVITPPGLYSPDSMVFTSTDANDPDGTRDFITRDKSNPNANVLLVTDIFQTYNSNPKWTYKINITRLAVPAVSAGPGGSPPAQPAVPAARGTIDPSIENTDES